MTTTVRAGLVGALALGAGVVTERAEVVARRKRRNGRNRKAVDTSTSTTTSNDGTNVSIAIGAPGASGPSVEIDS